MNNVQKQITVQFPQLTWRQTGNSYYAHVTQSSIEPEDKTSKWILVNTAGDIYLWGHQDRHIISLEKALKEVKKDLLFENFK